MDAVTLQARINAGYGKAASRIGYSYGIYRPGPSGAVLVPANLIGAIPASFDAQTGPFAFQRPQDEGRPFYKGLFDPTLVRSGDYLLGQQGTFLALRIDPIVPPLMARCEHVVSFSRASAGATQAGGYIGYIGQSASLAAIIRAGIPVSIEPSKERMRTTTLPGDARDLSILTVHVSVTAMPQGSILDGDIMIDEAGLRYQVNATYWSSVGYRLIALRIEV